MTVTELFFGRDIPGRAPLTEAEWKGFARRTIAAAFPDGFTVIDAEGGWRDPQSGRLIREPTKLLIVAAPPGKKLASRVDQVIRAYRRQFHQRAVGIVTRTDCAAFDSR